MTEYPHKTVLVLCNGPRILYLTRFELIKALADRGWTVYISAPIITGTEEKIRAGASPFRGIGCKFIDTPVDRRGLSPINDIKLIFTYHRLIKKYKPDLLLTFTIKPNIYGIRAGARKGILGFPTITGLGTSIQHRGWLQRIVFFLYHLAFRKVPRVFFQNRTNSELFRLLGLVRSEQMVSVSGSGVNIEHHGYQQYPDKGKPVRFLFIGRLMEEKGIFEYIEAARLIRAKHPEVVFGILGGKEETETRDLVKDLANDGLVEYFGYQKDVRPYIGAAHAVVLPSWHEGMANVLLEAAAAGRPVLASNISGCAETFDEGRSGFSFCPRDVNDLVAKLEHFLSLSHEERERMGRVGRAKMEVEFDRQKVVDTYLAEIDRILF